mgnify:FL=1
MIALRLMVWYNSTYRDKNRSRVEAAGDKRRPLY